jgi:hypothetical protein
MTIDGRNKQEIRLRVDISITLRSEHMEQEIRQILMRGVYNAFPNNPLIVNEMLFAEERDVHFTDQVRWTNITEQYKEKNESK